jgi:hypothetical protein
MNEAMTARLYFKSMHGEQVSLAIPGTKYELHLNPTGPVTPSPQGRVRGVVRCPVWKVDFVSAGGAYVEPLMGRPRRVQGVVVGRIETSNSVIVEVMGQPIVGDLPQRWNAADIAIGTRVGLDVHEGSTFEPASTAAAGAVPGGRERAVVNLVAPE